MLHLVVGLELAAKPAAARAGRRRGSAGVRSALPHHPARLWCRRTSREFHSRRRPTIRPPTVGKAQHHRLGGGDTARSFRRLSFSFFRLRVDAPVIAHRRIGARGAASRRGICPHLDHCTNVDVLVREVDRGPITLSRAAESSPRQRVAARSAHHVSAPTVGAPTACPRLPSPNLLAAQRRGGRAGAGTRDDARLASRRAVVDDDTPPSSLTPAVPSRRAQQMAGQHRPARLERERRSRSAGGPADSSSSGYRRRPRLERRVDLENSSCTNAGVRRQSGAAARQVARCAPRRRGTWDSRGFGCGEFGARCPSRGGRREHLEHTAAARPTSKPSRMFATRRWRSTWCPARRQPMNCSARRSPRPSGVSR